MGFFDWLTDDVLGIDDSGGIVGSIGNIADDVLGLDPNGGGIYDIPVVGDIADTIINSPIGNIVAFAFPPSAPFIYAAKTAQSAAKGNELGALLNAVGTYIAYNSPTPTTTATVGGMEISGINANLVEATKKAIEGGHSVTDIAKTLVGMGNQEAAARVMQDAGIDAKDAVDALNKVGQEAANYAPTAKDATETIKAMQDAGFSQEMIQEQVNNYLASGIPVDTSLVAPQEIPVNPVAQTFPLEPQPTIITETPLVKTYPLENPSINGTPILDGMPSEEFVLPEVQAGSIPVNTQPIMDTFQREYLNTGDLGTDGYYFTKVAAPNTGIPPEYWSTGGSSVAGLDGYVAPTVPDTSYIDNTAVPYEYVSPDEAGSYEIDTYTNEPVDVGNVPANAGVPAGGWSPDYGSEWGVGDNIGENLTEYGLGGFQNPLMDELQNSVITGTTGITLYDKLKAANAGLQGLKSIIGTSGGTGSSTGGTNGTQDQLYSGLMRQIDPYWDYRKQVEIPLMGGAAEKAEVLSNLYGQTYANPVSIYQRPEMQALNQKFMEEIARKDAALGRNSQYGARAVQAQNQFLTNTLPQYRTGLNQGLQTLYNAAKPQSFDMSQALEAAKGAIDAANQGQGQPPSGLAGAVSNLGRSWYQATHGNNIFDRAQGAIDTVEGVKNVYKGGKDLYDTVTGWFS